MLGTQATVLLYSVQLGTLGFLGLDAWHAKTLSASQHQSRHRRMEINLTYPLLRTRK